MNGMLTGPIKNETVSPGHAALRSETMASHLEIERVLALPDSIQSLSDYRLWLSRFMGFYQPLEALLGAFPDWQKWEIDFASTGHAQSLRHDLTALSVPVFDIELASRGDLPQISSFSHALGALYVMEGSKLGGRFILKDLTRRLGSAIEGADTYFTGYGATSGQRWTAFRDSLDRYISSHPAEFPSVVAGAEATFHSIQNWMSPLCVKGRP